jgi:hypothetical protein
MDVPFRGSKGAVCFPLQSHFLVFYFGSSSGLRQRLKVSILFYCGLDIVDK